MKALLHEDGSPVGINVIVRSGTNAALITYRVASGSKSKMMRATITPENAREVYDAAIRDFVHHNGLSETSLMVLDSAYEAFIKKSQDKITKRGIESFKRLSLMSLMDEAKERATASPTEQLALARRILEQLGLTYPLSKLK